MLFIRLVGKFSWPSFKHHSPPTLRTWRCALVPTVNHPRSMGFSFRCAGSFGIVSKQLVGGGDVVDSDGFGYVLGVLLSLHASICCGHQVSRGCFVGGGEACAVGWSSHRSFRWCLRPEVFAASGGEVGVDLHVLPQESEHLGAWCGDDVFVTVQEPLLALLDHHGLFAGSYHRSSGVVVLQYQCV